MARQLWPKEDPIGKRLRTFKSGAPGIIPNVLQNGSSRRLSRARERLTRLYREHLDRAYRC